MQTLNIEQGRLCQHETVKHVPSPNCDARPAADISLLVIHHISLPPHCFGGNDIVDFFCNRLDVDKDPFYQEIAQLTVSAHVLIKRNGELVQLVSFNDRAWHAGQSAYQGREACNDFSIGIELEGDEKTVYRYGQYKSLIALTKAIQTAYPQIGTNITGHENIAPGRKTDPGPTFDWQRYLEALSC
ncbi:MAG: 1,6-anhydro-N-acetylmuramyl-L-alanine amidase AmpD [Gammaproteobacteria bacterium]|nr:MAG: 1,6-anhydro-N-acetylmuramyl-L-alanine amidase AmpD [Gammaproteobacteria bacterium]